MSWSPWKWKELLFWQLLFPWDPDRETVSRPLKGHNPQYTRSVLRFPTRNDGEQYNEHSMSTAGKTPSMCTRNLKKPLITAPDSSSLTVFLQGHFLHIVSSGCQGIRSPDASMTLFLRLKTWKIGEYPWVGSFQAIPSQEETSSPMHPNNPKSGSVSCMEIVVNGYLSIVCPPRENHRQCAPGTWKKPWIWHQTLPL